MDNKMMTTEQMAFSMDGLSREGLLCVNTKIMMKIVIK